MGQFEIYPGWNDVGSEVVPEVSWESDFFPGIGDTMTVVVAAYAADGVVIASDSRETIGGGNPAALYRDDQKKLFQSGPCVVGAAGSGAWIGGLTKEIQNVATALDLGKALFSQLSANPGFPPAFCICVAAQSPIVVLESVTAQHDGRWKKPTEVYDPWRCVGVCGVANHIMGRFLTSNMDVHQVAAVCATAVEASGVGYLNVGGPTQIIGLFNDGRSWKPADTAAAVAKAAEWHSKAAALF